MDVETVIRAALREAGYGPDAIGSALPRILRILDLGLDVSEIVAHLKGHA